MESYHIYPENDIIKHETFGYRCECHPEVEYDRHLECMFVTHKYLDIEFDGAVDQAYEALGYRPESRSFLFQLVNKVVNKFNAIFH